LFEEVSYERKKHTFCQNVVSTKTNISLSIFLKTLHISVYLHSNCYVFRHQRAMFREFNNKKVISPTRTSGVLIENIDDDILLGQHAGVST